MRRTALWLGYGSAVSIIFSIALSQLLLGLGLVALLVSRKRLRFPPILLPLGLFFAYTVLAVLLSGHVEAGWPQIRKFFVFGIALLIASTFQSIRHAKILCLLWASAGCISAAVGIGQFVHRYREARAQGWGDYGFFLDSRLTGFTGQWMTYGGELMIVFLVTFSFIVFSASGKWRTWGIGALAVLWTALMLGLTRSVFLFGVPLGVTYLLWNRKRWMALLVPACAILLCIIAPFQVSERVVSIAKPHTVVDSNARRMIMARTGIAMVEAHPWFGVGPEQVAPQFLSYVPKDVSRPLPKGWYGHLHNVYLQYAAERGIPALLLMLWLLVKVIHDLHSGARRHLKSPSAWPLYGAVAVTIGILAEGFFEYNLGDSEVLTMFLSILACAYTVKWELERVEEVDSHKNVTGCANNSLRPSLEVPA